MAGEVKVLQFSEGVSTGAPTQVGVTATNLGTFANDAAYVADKGSAAANGDTYYNTTVHKQRTFTNGTWRSIADLDKTETFSNKSFDTVTSFTDTTQSTTKDTGAIVTEGGVGIEKNLNVGGDATITGDLTVNGTTTTINTATLDVEDANVTVNKNGTQATANSNVAGFKVEMSDATHAQVGYDSTLASKFKAGNVGSEAELITSTHTQSLSNKSFSSNTSILSGNQVRFNDSDNSNYIGISAPSSVPSDYNLALPSSNGTSNQFIKTDGSGNLSFENLYSSNSVINHAIATSVGSSALTIVIKASNGSDATSTNAITVAFRNATSATGTPSFVQVTTSLSMVISSGSTLGHSSGIPKYIYVYLINNSGTAEIAVSSTLYDEGSIVSTTAEGGAGAADSISAIYSTTTRINVALRLIGRLLSSQTTAGTWSSNMTEVSLIPFKKLQQPTIQRFTSGTGTYTTPAGVTWLKVTCIGGGGGGSGSGTASSGNGATGGDTTFGSSLLTAVFGSGGTGGGSGGNGGGGAINSPAISILNFTGGKGNPSIGSTGTGFVPPGVSGGNNPAGGAGVGIYNGPGNSGNTNTGGGGGGGSGLANASFSNSGSGGGAGGYIVAIIPNGSVSSSYFYSVGAGGNGGTAGTNGVAGGNGGSGLIVVEEFYN